MPDHVRALPFGSAVKHLVGAVLLVVAFGLYIFGTWGPAIQIRASGPQFLSTSTEARVFSMIGLLRLLLKERNYVPFACTLIFSFILPVIKFFLITLTLAVAVCCRRYPWSLWLPLKIVSVLRVVCKYQLVDAFSVILLVTFINFVGLTAEPLPAAHAYLVYCLLSIATTLWLYHCYSETCKRNVDPEEFTSRQNSPLVMSTAYQQSWECRSGATNGKSPTPSDLSEISTALSVMTTSFSVTSSPDDPGCVVMSTGTAMVRQDLHARVSRRLPLQKSGRASPRASDPFAGQGKARPLGVNRGHQVSSWQQRLCVPDSEEADLESNSSTSKHAFTELGTGSRSLGSTNVADCCPACPFHEYVARLCLLTLLLCASSFALLVCWVRPILTVALVPGKARGFAIETSTRSLGDVFLRLYEMGHAVSGCGIMLVFPILLTFIVYLASIGVLVGLCLLEWSQNARDADIFSYSLLDDEGRVCSTPPPAQRQQRILKSIKILARIARFAGDLAMPDVQSFGLITSFFIVNNIDFFGARLPAVPTEEPQTSLDRLLWNFSGFWAVMAFGISSTQVHKLMPPLREVSAKQIDSQQRLMGSVDRGYSSRAMPAIHTNTQRICEHREVTPIGPPIPLSMPYWRSKPPHPSSRRGSDDETEIINSSARQKSPPISRYAKIILHGGIRLALAFALLLPVWLHPIGVLDVDLQKVNLQLQSLVEYLNPALGKALPQSVGDCLDKDHSAPLPCFGSQPLEVIRAEDYDARARWVTGLRSTRLQTARFDLSNDNRIVLTVSGHVQKLALSLRIGECIYRQADEECPVLWDNTDSCCSDNTTFSLQVGVECQNTFPYLRNATLLPTHVSRLVVVEKIMGVVPVEVADITSAVEERISDTVQVYLDPRNKWIHWTGGETLSFMEFLNRILAINAPNGLICPHIVSGAPRV